MNKIMASFLEKGSRKETGTNGNAVNSHSSEQTLPKNPSPGSGPAPLAKSSVSSTTASAATKTTRSQATGVKCAPKLQAVKLSTRAQIHRTEPSKLAQNRNKSSLQPKLSTGKTMFRPARAPDSGNVLPSSSATSTQKGEGTECSGSVDSGHWARHSSAVAEPDPSVSKEDSNSIISTLPKELSLDVRTGSRITSEMQTRRKKLIDPVTPVHRNAQSSTLERERECGNMEFVELPGTGLLEEEFRAVPRVNNSVDAKSKLTLPTAAPLAKLKWSSSSKTPAAITKMIEKKLKDNGTRQTTATDALATTGKGLCSAEMKQDGNDMEFSGSSKIDHFFENSSTAETSKSAEDSSCIKSTLETSPSSKLRLGSKIPSPIHPTPKRARRYTGTITQRESSDNTSDDDNNGNVDESTSAEDSNCSKSTLETSPSSKLRSGSKIPSPIHPTPKRARRYTGTVVQRQRETPDDDNENVDEPENQDLRCNSSTISKTVSTDDRTDRNLGLISGDSSHLGTLDSGPLQPRITFPKTTFDKKQRSFSATFYAKYSWLEYSCKTDRVFCYVCRLFAGKALRKQNEKFASTGFNNWKKVGEKLMSHDNAEQHKKCYERFLLHKQSKSSGNIHEKLLTVNEEQIQRNREYLKKLVDIILCLARQGLPLRGHREGENMKNRGNFLEFADLFAKFDNEFSNQLNKRTNYCSPKIQNEVLGIATDYVIDQIAAEVKRCGFFSIMVDEARNCKEQQLSIVIRYAKGLVVEERFLGFINCSESRDAATLAKIMLQFFEKCGLGKLPVVAQSYDGASVMSGKHRGVQAVIKERHPQAIYIHCLAHRLNLAVVDSCANISTSAKLFSTLEALHVFLSQPGNHAVFKSARDALEMTTGSYELGSLSQTRWSCRYENCRSVIQNYAPIREALQAEINDGKQKESVQAIGIMTCMSSPEFVVSIIIFHWILAELNIMSKYFQKKDATLGRAGSMLTSVVASLKEKRGDFDEIWTEIENFANQHEISLEPTVNTKRRPASKKDSNYYTSTIGHTKTVDLPDSSTKDFWRINVYYQVIDNVVGSLEARFSSMPLAEAADALVQLDMEGAKEFIDHYAEMLNIDYDDLRAESVVMKNFLRQKNLTPNLETLKKELKPDITPNLYIILQVAVCIPISSAGCERSFSAMRRIHTWLRSTMTQDRFSNLSILSIENDLVKKGVTAEAIIEIFQQKNRKLLLHD